MGCCPGVIGRAMQQRPQLGVMDDRHVGNAIKSPYYGRLDAGKVRGGWIRGDACGTVQPLIRLFLFASDEPLIRLYTQSEGVGKHEIARKVFMLYMSVVPVPSAPFCWETHAPAYDQLM